MCTSRTDVDKDKDPDMESDRTRASRETFDTGTMKWVSGIVALIGLWIAASPFLYNTTGMASWNNLAVGLAIFLIAGFTFYQLAAGKYAAVGALSLVVLLGLWIVASPYVMEFNNDTMTLSNVVSGAAVTLIAAYDAYANREAQSAEMGTRA